MRRRAGLVLPWLALLALACARPPADGALPLLADGTRHHLAAGTTVRFRVPLAAGDYLRLAVEQVGVDVDVLLYDPAGALVLRADRSLTLPAPERVEAVAESGGDHVLVVVADASRTTPPAEIAFRGLVRRPATAEDRRRAAAYAGFLSAEALADDDEGEAALDGYRRAIAEGLALGDRRLAAEAATRLGDNLFLLRRYDDARQAFARAASSAPRGDLWHLVALEHLGLTHLALQEPEQAILAYGEARALAEALEHRAYRARCHSGLGSAYRRLGRIQDAIDHLEAARRLFRPWERNLASVHYDLGLLYHWNLGQPEHALELLEQARRSYSEPAFVATTANQIAAAHQALGAHQAAVARYEEALAIRRALGARCAAASTLVRLALADATGSASDDRAHEARRILAEEGCPGDRAAVHRRLGELEERAGRSAAALADYRESLDLYRRSGDRTGEAIALVGTARSCRRLSGCFHDPLALARDAERIFEETRGDLVKEEHRLALGSQTSALFDLVIDLEWSHGLYAGAFASAEQARARALRDRLREVGADAAEPVDPPIALAEVSRRLPAGSVLLAYRLGEARSFLWLADGDGERHFALPPRAEIEAAAERARALLVAPQPLALGSGHLAAPLRALAERILPAELLPTLAGRRLLVVADGALELVPFAALPGPDGAPLVERHEIVHLPSASVWAALRDRPRPPSPAGVLALVADPIYGARDERFGARAAPARPRDRPRGSDAVPLERLSGAGREADAIVATAAPTAGVLALRGFDATKAAVLGGRLRGYRYVHFATHGVVNRRQPLLSHLVLSQLDRRGAATDGVLSVRELYDLELPTDLVVLAGCETGVGPLIPGEGLVSGLARAFLHAGARRVVVSLWPISDRATPALMRRFYERLLASGDPVSSLRLAQRELYRAGRPPYEWAGFVIQGD